MSEDRPELGADIAAEFIIEAQESEQLVALEQAADDSAQLNAVFRSFHTLKGGAGFLGIMPMVELCHAAEETLGAARAGKTALSSRHFDAAQQSLDWLQSMLDAVAAGTEPTSAPAELIAQFALEEQAAVTAPAAAEADALISDDEFEALLDQLHGTAIPGSHVPPPLPTPAPPPAPLPRPVAPIRPPKASGHSEAEHSVRVDTRRLDAIVNLIGALVLARNRLKTLRTRIVDEELDRAVGSLDVATARLQSAVMRTRMQPVGKVFSRQGRPRYCPLPGQGGEPGVVGHGHRTGPQPC